jgi:hypothetical protein
MAKRNLFCEVIDKQLLWLWNVDSHLDSYATFTLGTKYLNGTVILFLFFIS